MTVVLTTCDEFESVSDGPLASGLLPGCHRPEATGDEVHGLPDRRINRHKNDLDFLKENPTVRIGIEGHTDNVGRLEDNMALSNDRAFTVMGYLQEHGIATTIKGVAPDDGTGIR